MRKKLFIFSTPIEKFYNISDPVNIFVKDLSGFYLESNDCTAELAGLLVSQTIGRCDLDLPWADSYSQTRQNDLLVQQSGVLKVFFEQSSDLGCQLLCLKAPVRDSSQHLVGCFGIAYYLNKMSLPEITNSINKNMILSLTQPMEIQLDVISRDYFLTQREKGCAYYLLRGMSAKQIGQSLSISPKTVETHISKLKVKLGCYTRSQLIEKIMDYCP